MQSGNSRYLVKELASDPSHWNFIQDILLIDKVILTNKNHQILNKSFYLFFDDSKSFIGREMVGAPINLDGEVETLDEKAGETIVSPWPYESFEFKDILDNINRIKTENDLKNVKLCVINSNFETIEILSSKAGAFNWS